jgi:SAM-dependent methyltransferase
MQPNQPGWETRTSKDRGLTHSLDLLADTYNYNHWIYYLARPWLGDQILEIGAGVGNLTQFLLNAKRVVCVEPEPDYWGRLNDIAALHRNVTVHTTPLEGIPAGVDRFDSVLCVNVLEHIENDEQALQAMADRLRPGGHVVLYVPATPWAFGKMDTHLGHWRRYNRRRIRSLASACSLSIARLHYVNFVGLLGWWWCGRIRKETLIDPRKARIMDSLVPYLSAFERLIPIPAGQSLLAVLKRNE